MIRMMTCRNYYSKVLLVIACWYDGCQLELFSVPSPFLLALIPPPLTCTIFSHLSLNSHLSPTLPPSLLSPSSLSWSGGPGRYPLKCSIPTLSVSFLYNSNTFIICFQPTTRHATLTATSMETSFRSNTRTRNALFSNASKNASLYIATRLVELMKIQDMLSSPNKKYQYHDHSDLLGFRFLIFISAPKRSDWFIITKSISHKWPWDEKRGRKARIDGILALEWRRVDFLLR